MDKESFSIKVSVIIPVHNMAEWIETAIETVEAQTLEAVEIICVDDGSTDQTSSVLEKCKKKHPDITVLRQVCQGPGAARNRGIQAAAGEYIAFLDADDYYYSEDALKYLYTKAIENHAMICRGSSCDNRNGVLSYDGLRPERVFAREGYIEKEDFPGPTGFWAGIYNRDFLIRNKLWFPDLLQGEDGLFSVMTIIQAGRVYCSDKIVYVYRKEHKMVVFTEKRAVDAVKAVYEMMQLAAQNNMNRLYNSWKNAFYGQTGALMYKFAADGNPEMLELAQKTNALLGGNLYEGDRIKEYMSRVRKEKSIFLERLKSRDSVYVFGAGTVGRKVISYLLRNDINLAAVIVSSKEQNPEAVEGVQVKGIEAIDLTQNYEVIIASYWYTQDEIRERLNRHGVTNLYPLDLCAFQLWQDEIMH